MRKLFKNMQIVMICSMLLIVGFFVKQAAPVQAETLSQELIMQVEGSSNIEEVLKVGNWISHPSFEVTAGAPAVFNRNGQFTGTWEKLEGDQWVAVRNKPFVSGTWRYVVMAGVYNEDVRSYFVTEDTKVQIDGQTWTFDERMKVQYQMSETVSNCYSYGYWISPEYTLEAPETFAVFGLDHGWQSVSSSQVNAAVYEIYLTDYFDGGQKPYSFTKVSGPDWVRVSNEGTISGMPKVSGVNDPLVIEATDAVGEKIQLTLPVRDTVGDTVVEVGSFEELVKAFEEYAIMDHHVTIKLTKDIHADVGDYPRNQAYICHLIIKAGADVTFDFNGHTMSCTDDVSTTDLESAFSEFVRITINPKNPDEGSSLRFVDSVGGGGMRMTSNRAFDTQIATLSVRSGQEYKIMGYTQFTSKTPSKVYFDGGNFYLEANTEKFGSGTIARDNWYRACVVTSHLYTEINDGTFEVSGKGPTHDGNDLGCRELSAFATSTNEVYRHHANDFTVADVEYDKTVINGGFFKSVAYAVHHFDPSGELGKTNYMSFPKINGGCFVGRIGYVGMTFDYSDDNNTLASAYKNLPAGSIISENAYVTGINGKGKEYTAIDGMALKDLHEVRSCYVISPELMRMDTLPAADSETAELNRLMYETENFKIQYQEPCWFEAANMKAIPIFEIVDSKTEAYHRVNGSECTITYSDYRNGVDVYAVLQIISGEKFLTQVSENYHVNVVSAYTVTDESDGCRVVPVDGKFTVMKGESYSFRIETEEYYEIIPDKPFYIFVNGSSVEPVDGVYTVENVSRNLEISSGGTGLKGYANLNISPGSYFGEPVVVKQYVGDTYVLGAPEDYGFDVPAEYAFDHWTVSTTTKKGYEGSKYKIPQIGEIYIEAQWGGVYQISVIGGKAYLDEEYTKPVTYAPKDARIYVKADDLDVDDPRIFNLWKETSGRAAYFVGGYADPETSFIVGTEDLVLEATYNILIKEVAVGNVKQPAAGVPLEIFRPGTNQYVEEVEGSAYRFSHSSWEGIKEGEVFEKGKTYRYIISFGVNEGYEFADTENIGFYMKGINASDYRVVSKEFSNSYKDYLKVTVEFDIPDEERPEPTETPGEERPEPTEAPGEEGPEPTEEPGVVYTVTEIFSDVFNDWYTPYVQYVYDHDLMTGIKGTTRFEPNSNITKAQVAQVLYNMDGKPVVLEKPVFTELKDVYEAEWYADAVAWAYNTGVVTGDLNTKKFSPNAKVTREQLALMMYRYTIHKGYDTSATSDLAGLKNAEKTSNWALDGVKWAVGQGLISGVEKNGVKDLQPQGNASRAQMAAILQRFCENVK